MAVPILLFIVAGIMEKERYEENHFESQFYSETKWSKPKKSSQLADTLGMLLVYAILIAAFYLLMHFWRSSLNVLDLKNTEIFTTLESYEVPDMSGCEKKKDGNNIFLIVTIHDEFCDSHTTLSYKNERDCDEDLEKIKREIALNERRRKRDYGSGILAESPESP